MFEFYYQTGEFSGEANGLIDFFKDLVVQIAGTGIGAYGAFWLYKLQSKDSKERDLNKQIQQEKDRLLFFDHLVISSLKISRYIQSELEKMITELKIDPYYMSNFSILAKEDLRRLVFDTKRDDIFLAYRSLMNDNNIQNIFNSIDSMHSLLENTLTIWRDSSVRQVKTKTAITDCLNLILNEMNRVKPENDDDYAIKYKLNDIVSSYEKYFHSDRRDYSHLSSEFLVPLINAMSKMKSRTPGKWEVTMELVQDCRRKIITLSTQGLDLMKNLGNSFQTLKVINETLDKSFQPLHNYLEDHKDYDPIP